MRGSRERCRGGWWNVEFRQFIFGGFQPVRGGLLEPLACFFEVARDAQARLVDGADAELGVGVTLVGGFAVEEKRLCIVLGNALAIFVHEAEIVLTGRKVLIDGFAVPG